MNSQQELSAHPRVLMLDDEHEVFFDLICGSPRATAGITLLWQEVQRATVVPTGTAPDGVVRIDSRVRFVDLQLGDERTVRVVYPEEAVRPGLEPVTGSIGAALIGLRAGDRFEWRDADGRVRQILLRRVDGPRKPWTPKPPFAATSAEVRRSH